MTHKEHAEKVYRELVGADVTADDAFGRDTVSIIAAALKKQREACAKIAVDYIKWPICVKAHKDILNAEMKE